MNRRQRFARIAVELAGALEQDVTHQLCALVVSKNRVLSVGYNQPKTHPVAKDTLMQQLHAEMHALIQCADKHLQGAEVIVARTRPSGKPGLAKPCGVCESILKRSGIRRVFYTIDSDDAENLQLGELVL